VKSNAQTVDLLISHSQIQFRARAFDEAACRWGKLNLEQGAILHRDYVVFDPLPEDAFGANVHLKLEAAFSPDPGAQRCIVAPFHVADAEHVEVASAAERFKLDLALEARDYALYFEVCEGEEIFYRITLVPADGHVAARYLLDDPWGGEKDKPLLEGLR